MSVGPSRARLYGMLATARISRSRSSSPSWLPNTAAQEILRSITGAANLPSTLRSS
jgi:hypothetical protein